MTQPPLPVAGVEQWDIPLNDYLAALDSRLTDLSTSLTGLSNQVASLSSQITTINNNLTALTNRVTTAENNISTLQTRTALSFLRAFGPDTSTTIPVSAWTAIVLDPAGEPWRQFGVATWEWIGPSDPDYAISPAGIRCLQEGIYDFAGSVVFNAAQGTGTRGVRVIEVKGPYAGQWQLTQSVPMPKGTLTPVLVAGEAYQYAGNIIELQAWSDTATSTMNNPQSEWLSAALIALP